MERKPKVVKAVNNNFERIEFEEFKQKLKNQPIDNKDDPEEIQKLRRMILKKSPGEILSTIGIELESLGLSQRDVSLVLSTLPQEFSGYFKVTRDGSAEIKCYQFPLRNRLVRISSHTEAAEQLFSRNGNKETVGYEVVSIPMLSEVAEGLLGLTLPKLQAAGDFTNERCAIHYHVGFPKNLRYMKNALALGLHLDDLFYAISSLEAGKKFRGYSNNAIYARPLCNGPWFRYDSSYYQVLNYKAALKAETIYDFFAAYALDINTGERPKYHPARYFGWNIYSILLHDTLEFRYFNQTFNARTASASMKLCQLVAETAVMGDYKKILRLEVCDPFTTESPSYYIAKLRKFLELAELSGCEHKLTNKDIESLEEIIYSYKGIGIENANVLTHCKEISTVTTRLISDGNLERMPSGKKPIPDGHIDIHNIKYQNLMR